MTTIDTAEIPELLERALKTDGPRCESPGCGRRTELEVYCCQHGNPDSHARIAALEAELAEKGRELAEARQWYDTLEAELVEKTVSFESERQQVLIEMETVRTVREDRDRERSRREALEREVRELARQWIEAAPNPERECDETEEAVCAVTDKHCAELHAILDRAAKDSKGGDAHAMGTEPRPGANLARTEPDSTSVSVDAPQPEEGRDSAEAAALCQAALYWNECMSPPRGRLDRDLMMACEAFIKARAAEGAIAIVRYRLPLGADCTRGTGQSRRVEA